VRYTSDRSCKAPAQNQKCDNSDHQHLDRYVKKDSAPDANNLGPYVSCVVDDNDLADHDIVRRVYGGNQHMSSLQAQPYEFTHGSIACQRVRHELWCAR